MKIDLNECLFITAHEIKNSLSGVIMGLKRLEDEVKDKDFLKLLSYEAERLFLIATDSLTISKPLKLHLTKSNFKTLINEVLFILKDDILKKGIKIEIEISDNFPDILCDKDKFKTVFTNLFVNAIYHTPDGKKIKVKGELKEENVIKIIFQDEGEGIELENPRNIFYKFFTKRNDGTGLGLAIVHKIVYEHFGEIEVLSKKNEGTCFIITMPVDFHFIDRRKLKDRRTGRDRRRNDISC